MRLIYSIILFILLLTGCKEPDVGIFIPSASSSELNVRTAQYSRTFGRHSLTDTELSKSSATNRPSRVQNVYIPIDAKNLPSIANERRIALVIGNGNYQNAGKLRNPINDANSMALELESLGFKVMKYRDLTLVEMKKAVDSFGRVLDNYDVSLFFYAGHGIQVNGNNYLLPIDAKIDSKNDVEYNGIEAGRVLAKMEDAKCQTNIIILDACRNNPFERSWKRGVKISGGSGLAFMNAPSGSLIAYATAPGSTAADGEEGTNGVYTSALLKHMKTPNITIEEMFKRVRVTVEQRTNKKQISWESTSLKGNFFFKIQKPK
jgi:uncharacterized caspase-like protein